MSPRTLVAVRTPPVLTVAQLRRVDVRVWVVQSGMLTQRNVGSNAERVA